MEFFAEVASPPFAFTLKILVYSSFPSLFSHPPLEPVRDKRWWGQTKASRAPDSPAKWFLPPPHHHQSLDDDDA